MIISRSTALFFKYNLLLAFILCFTLSNAQMKYPSLLWKISGNGLKKPSYLYGTMHVSNRVAYHLSEQFFDALKSVDVVGLETNPGEWMENMHKTGEISQQTLFSNSYLHERDFYRSVFSVQPTDRRMLQTILNYDPDLINGLLYRHSGGKDNFEENTYIDLFIFQAASKLNKKVISLEDFVQSEIKARLSSLPDEETEQPTRLPFVSETKIEEAYRTGNLDLLDSLSKRSTSKNMQKYLINDRNIFFVNTIDSVLKKSTLFSGVGAAHLPGEKGVIELLRKKGYTLEPVYPSNTKKSDQMRDDLDAMVKPVTFTKQFSIDSVFSCSVPGQLSPVVDLENVKFNIYADMVNGNFYTTVRLRYLGPLFGQNAESMKLKVDSLLFENIPGKIITKNEILSNNGLKGIEIVNKTRRGDLQHYQIYFTDLEIILFKMGGKGEYANGSEAKQFFSNIQFKNKNEERISFSPPTKGFSLKLPGNFTYVKNSGASTIGLTEDLAAYDKKSKKYYGLKHAVYNDFDYLEEDTFELNLISKNILRAYDFEKNITRSIRPYSGFPSIRFSAANKEGNRFHGQVIIKGVHYYFLFMTGDKNCEAEEEFFASLRLSDFESTQPIKRITDKELAFTAMDEVSDNSASRFNELYAKELEKEKGDEQRKKEQEQARFDFDYRTERKAYYSPSSNEYVNIVFEKFNDYDMRTHKEFEEILEKNVKNVNSIIVSKPKISKEKGIYTYETVLRDTATARALAFKMFLQGGTRYEICAPFDTTIGLRGWTKGFFESFQLKDTTIGVDITRNKFSDLVNDLCSADTVKRRKANHSVQNSISMQKAYLQDFLSLINSGKFASISEDSRAQLLVNGGTLENDGIILPYKKMYKQYSDSFYLQLSLLKGLAFLKTQNSYNAFAELLNGETPLVGEESLVKDVFNVLSDSLELCKKFFPSFFVLAKYDEYRGPVYSLLAQLLEKKLITSSLYLNYKDGILADAHLAQKRYNPNARNNANAGRNDLEHLDKTARENAENLMAGLEGLSNNNVLKNSKYLNNLIAAGRHELVNYAILLAPFYKSDEKVKQFFTRLEKIRAQYIAMPLLLLKTENQIKDADTLFSYYCRNITTRAYFYSELEKKKLSDKFMKSEASQKKMVESVIMAQLQLAKIYAYEKDKKKDSLDLVGIYPAKNKYQKGQLYVYTLGKGKTDSEQWAIAFVAASNKEINTDVEVLSLNSVPDASKSKEENIQELIAEFSLTFRKRAVTADLNTYYQGY